VKKSSVKRIFPYKQFEADISKWFVAKNGTNAATRTAWGKLKGLIAVNAAVDYGMRPSSTEAERDEAMAKAWEDGYIAFKGYGDNTITGPILQMWHYVIDKDRESLRQAIQSACDAVDVYYQEHGVRRRYLEKYWKAKVRCKPEDFREPTALPLSGRALRDWTSDEGYDYETFEQVIHEMEIKEQARRAARKASGDSRKAPPGTGSASGTVIQFPGKK